MGAAYLQYTLKFILFASVAFGGILLGIRLKKAKDSKDIKEVNEVKGKDIHE